MLKLDKERNAISAEIALAKEQLGPVGTDAPLVDAEGFPRADVDLLAVRTLRQRVVVLTNDYKAKQREIDTLLQQLHALGPAAFVAAKPTFADAGADGAASGGAGALAAGPASASAAAPAAADGSGRAVRPAEAVDAAFRGLALPDHASAYTPFARVDEVSPASPAAEAGLQVGDRIAVFGTLVSLAPGAGAGGAAAAAVRPPALSDLGALVRASQSIALPVVVLRAAGGAGAGAADVAMRLVLTPRPWSGAGLLGCHVVPAT